VLSPIIHWHAHVLQKGLLSGGSAAYHEYLISLQSSLDGAPGCLPQLDPALIDEVTWPEHPSAADCAFVAGYGPGGVNDTRALLLRRGARAWPLSDRISLRSLSWKYPEAW
jgi:hypothetical protein